MVQSYFFNAIRDAQGNFDREYDSEDFSSYLDLLVGSGVFPTPSTQLQVRASSGMQIAVGAGQGWIKGHKMINTADKLITIDQADVLLHRIDSVIFYCDWSTRTMDIEVKKGTNSASPVAPAPTRTGTRWEMVLAHVRVDKQTTTITNAMITDTRGNNTICGYVAGLIQQIETTTLFQQFQAAWDSWFDQIRQNVLQITGIARAEHNYKTTGASESVFNVKTYITDYDYTVDILDIYVSGVRLQKNEYTQNQSTVTLVTPITHAGTDVAFVVLKLSGTPVNP